MEKRKKRENLTNLSQNLRKNPTKEERRLWYDFLKDYDFPVHRQYVIGKYIADFYISKAKLAIELDGSQHFEKAGLIKDAERTAYLEQYGIKVIRIPNNLINSKFRDVCEYIDEVVKQAVEEERQSLSHLW